jgi:hypothetical protein
MRDLVVLVPDKNTEYVVLGVLSRPQALGIRAIDFKVIVDPGHDGGVRRRGAQILHVERHQFSHAVLMFDYEGSGATERRSDLEAGLDATLSQDWGRDAKTIIIEPEVDVWMWGAEAHLKSVVRWKFPEGIRDWLGAESFSFTSSGKPVRPKEALEAVFRRAQVSRSSASYQALAKRLSLARCEDPAFHRLRERMVEWFGN